ncbi:MAG: YncE family protein [Candidatus Dormibacteria bacterium]
MTPRRVTRHAVLVPVAVLALVALGQCGVAYAMFTDLTSAGPMTFQTATLTAPSGVTFANGCSGGTGQTNVTASWTGPATKDASNGYLVTGMREERSTSAAGTYSATGTPGGSAPNLTDTDVNPSGAITPNAYVAGGEGSAATLASVLTSTNALTKLTTGTLGKEPNALAVTPDGTKLIAAEGASHEVQIITTATQAIATVTLPTVGAASDPVAVAVSPDGTTAWVVDKANNLLYPITIATDTLGTGITVGTQSDPTALLITPDGTKVYVGDYGAHEVSVVSTATKAVTNTITIGATTGHPIALAVTPNSAHVYVADQANNDIDDITVSSETVTSTIAVGSLTDGNVTGAGDPNILAVTPDGTKLYVASYTGGSVEDITVSSDTLATTIKLSSYTEHRTVAPEPDALAITPNGCQLYVADYDNRQVDAITVSNDTPTAEPAVGTPADPTGIAAIPSSADVYVANEGTHTLSEIATSTNTATTVTLPAGSTAYAVVVDPSPYYYEFASTHGGWASALSSSSLYGLGWDSGTWQ